MRKVLVLLVLLASSTDSLAALCGSRKEIITTLENNHQEKRRVLGYINDTAVLEIFVSEKKKFTILVSGTGGLSCILVTGDNWDEQNIDYKSLLPDS